MEDRESPILVTINNALFPCVFADTLDPDYMKFLETYQNPQKPQNSFTPEMVLEEIEARDKELKGKGDTQLELQRLFVLID